MGWKIVPICDKQKLDVNPNDLLNNGDFRKCDVYKGGGGYDRFPYICEKRFGKRYNHQFVVQLYGCCLKCPYCYVTHNGIWGEYKLYNSYNLVKCFHMSGQEIFHLMGGSPGLYIEKWHKIINLLSYNTIFHSDLLLIEKEYKLDWITSINQPYCLYAVNIKGTTRQEFFDNTGVVFDQHIENLFWHNFDLIIKSKLNFYITFTNINNDNQNKFKEILTRRYGNVILNDSFSIDLIQYNAIKN